MNIVSWNVNGLRAILKKDFINSIEKLNPDVLCLQETKAGKDEIITALSNFRDYSLYSNSVDRKGYSGTAILSKVKPITVVNDMGKSEYDTEGRIVCAEYPDFYLVNVYVPNAGQKLERLGYRQHWDQYFLKYIKKLEKTKPVIVCGDFNVAHKPIDLKNDKSNYNKTAGYTQIEIDGMSALINSGFVDLFRFFHPNEIAYTFWSYRFKARERNVGWRMDYFLASNSIIKKIKSVNIGSNFYGSDHCPIILELDL